MTLLNQVEKPWQNNPAMGTMPGSFRLFKEQFLTPLGRMASSIEREQESAEYAAIRFEMGEQSYLFRQAKHTPKKIGQFVTLWKRPTPDSEIAPFDRGDGIDQVIIFADEETRFGVFVFPSQILTQKDIFAKHSEGGKRAFRIYPPWTVPVAMQAKRSKTWQCACFVELTDPEVGRARLSQFL